MNSIIQVLLISFFIFFSGCKKNNGKDSVQETIGNILEWTEFSNYIKEFNEKDVELYVQYIPNNQAEVFLKKNIPFFQCPDKEFERTYYFRWWTFRKHIKNTPAGYVITEFLPDVPWAGKYNTINCAAGHHFYEGRWLHNPTYLQDYANFWFKGAGSPRSYSFWAANSILAFTSVLQNKELVNGLLPYFDRNFIEWEKSNLCDDGLFWQSDDRDGMEISIGGSGKRPTINSYMFGEAIAIANIAEMNGNIELMIRYRQKAEVLEKLILSKLWDVNQEFFKTKPLTSEELGKIKNSRNSKPFMKYDGDKKAFVDVRELYGFTPWYFNIPKEQHSIAWKFLLSPDGFKAPFGPTTAEQVHPGFKVVYEGHECQWNGPGWPYATSITLKALANLLRNYNQSVISKSDFIQLLETYSNSHRRINEKGEKVCWIDENLNPFTGDWVSRTMLKARGDIIKDRGKDYNHSIYCDLIISDLVGIRPSMDNTLIINPLISADYWRWFCLDRVQYHGKMITIVWDKKGTKYNLGKGFFVFVNGVLKMKSNTIEKLKVTLN